MIKIDFKLIENEFNLILPEQYKKIIESDPFGEQKWEKVRSSLFTNEKDIISYNQMIRKEGYFNKKWPNNFFVIGAVRSKSYTIIDLKKKKNFKVYALIQEEQLEHNDKIIIGNPINIENYIKAQKMLAD